MQRVKLWVISDGHNHPPTAVDVESLASADSERMLEDLLVDSPQLLEPGLTLLARQLPTANGPLDLLGADRSGRLVVFELKRGVLARDAVAQVIDYASDISQMSRPLLSQHISERSGRDGVSSIQDFDAWYSDRFSDEGEKLDESPRMVLVGLGIDARARRMVQFLADTGVDIDVITFQAFEIEGKTVLARQVEELAEARQAVSRQSETWRRESLERGLGDRSTQLDVGELLQEMRAFVSTHMQTGEGSPNKGGVTFYKKEYADDPSGPARAYAAIGLDDENPGHLNFILTYRAKRDGGQPVAEFLESVHARQTRHAIQGYEQHEVSVTAENWGAISKRLEPALAAVARGVASAAQSAGSAATIVD